MNRRWFWEYPWHVRVKENATRPIKTLKLSVYGCVCVSVDVSWKLGERLGWECNYIYVSVYISMILYKPATPLDVKYKDNFPVPLFHSLFGF
jgi:hypothetical protein